MCTLSIIGLGERGYRVGHARDEQRTRAEAVAPAWREVAGHKVLCPTDPDAGGTWVTLRDDGLCTGVLNVNIPGRGRPEDALSRGEVPLMLAGLDSQSERRSLLAEHDWSRYSTFTGFAVERRAEGVPSVLVARWDGETVRVTREPGADFSPVCVASSGLGDEIVQSRVPLFDGLVRADPTPQNQDAFHAHMWEDRPEQSVMMSRKDARTVSVTVVEVGDSGAGEMRYTALPEGAEAHDPVGALLLQ